MRRFSFPLLLCILFSGIGLAVAQRVEQPIRIPLPAPLPPEAILVKPDLHDKETQQALSEKVKTAFRNNDFKTLEEVGQGYLDRPSKTNNGWPMLTVFTAALTSAVEIEWPKEWNIEGQSECDCQSSDPKHYAEGNRRWNAVDAKLQAWAKRYPHSLMLPIARMKYAINRAWFYRGSDYASKVRPDAWQLFERYMNEAEKTLQASAATRYKNPAWYPLAAKIAVIADWPEAQRAQLYADMIEHAALYPPAFIVAAEYLDPNWGGSYAAIDDLIRKAQQHASEQDGLELYARVYVSYLGSESPSFRSPKETAADWAAIKQGLEIMIKRYPDRENYDSAAKLACLYEDRQYFDDVTRRIGTVDQYKNFPIDYLDCNRSGFIPEVHYATPSIMPALGPVRQ